MPDAACDDRGVNAETLSQFNDGKRRRIVFNAAGVPYVAGDQSILSPFIGLIFLWIAPRTFHVAEAKVVNKGI